MSFILLYSFSATAADLTGYLLRPSKPVNRINELNFEAEEVSVSCTPAARVTEDAHCSFELNGTYERKNWVVFLENSPRPFSLHSDEIMSKQEFSLRLQLTTTYTGYTFVAISPEGQVQKEQIYLFFPKWNNISKSEEYKKWSVSASIGVSSIQYTETSLAPFSERALTGKLAYNYMLSPPRLDIGVSTFFTVLPLSTSDPNSQAYFLGANLRIGYAPVVKDPWRISIQTGIYYTTMFVSNNAFGFQNMMGPQLYPVVTRKIGINAISVYAKFSPIGSGAGISSFSNNEMATGFSFRHPLKNGHAYSIGLDVSRLSFALSEISVNMSSISLSTGFSW